MPQEHRFGSVPVPCLTVVIPCYNEEATVTGALKRVLESPYVAEVIFVDDGSTDESLEPATTVFRPAIEVLSFQRNRGKGAALRAAFARVSSPFVIVQDADWSMTLPITPCCSRR